MSTEQPDPSQCPLCGSGNECSIVRGDAIAACWCASANISRNVLDAIPAELRNRACICPRCAAGATSAESKVSIWSNT